MINDLGGFHEETIIANNGKEAKINLQEVKLTLKVLKEKVGL